MESDEIGVGVYKCRTCGKEYQEGGECKCVAKFKFDQDFKEKVKEIAREIFPIPYADAFYDWRWIKFAKRFYDMGKEG